MSIPPTAYCEIDFGNPACFTNGGTAVNDLSPNGRDFTLNNTGYTYDASVGALTMPQPTQAFGTPGDFIFNQSAYTFTAWVKLLTADNSCVFYIGLGGGTGSRIFVTLSPFGSLNNIDNSGSAQQATPITFDNNWHLLAVTKPVNGIVGQQLTYIDGVLIPQGLDYNPSAVVNITSPDTASIHYSQGGDLSIATFTIYDQVLDATDLLSIYNSEVSRFYPPSPPTPVLELDAGNPASYSGSGTSWNDLTASNFDYTMVNPIWSASEGGYFTFVSPGDGVPPVNYGYKTVPGALSTQQTDFTMQVWIRVPAGIPPGSLPDGMAIFYNGDAGPNYNGYGMGIKWAYYAFTGRMPGIEAPGYAGYYATDPADAFPSDAWTLFTLTIDSSSTLKIYYNDTLMETISSATLGPRPPTNIAICYIGTNSNAAPYPQSLNADVAVIRFYDTAVDLAFITDQYTNEVSRFTPLPPVTGLSNGRRFGQGFPQ